jgi:hypothetical protein
MYDDVEARKTVRDLMKGFEEAIARSLGLAFVRSMKDCSEVLSGLAKSWLSR